MGIRIPIYFLVSMLVLLLIQYCMDVNKVSDSIQTYFVLVPVAVGLLLFGNTVVFKYPPDDTGGAHLHDI
jgi:hypothetical protein